MVTFRKLLFNFNLFHRARMKKKNGFVVFVNWGVSFTEAEFWTVILSHLDWSNYLLCPFGFLFGHIIKILSTKLGRSEGSRLDLMHWYMLMHWVRPVSVTLIPQRSYTLQWFNTNWLDVLDFWSYPNHVQISWPSCLLQLLTSPHSFNIFFKIYPLLIRVLPLTIFPVMKHRLEKDNFSIKLVRKI